MSGKKAAKSLAVYTQAAAKAGKAYKAQAPVYLKKWWKYYEPTSGMITRTLSPFELKVVEPFMKKWWGNMQHRITDNFFDVLPGLMLGVTFYFGGNWYRQRLMYQHRD